MNLSRLFLCLGFIVFVSCRHERKVVFPEKVPNEINQYIDMHKYTIVIYVETAQCTTCTLSNLLSWKVQKKTLDKYDVGILLVFDSQDENKVIEILKSLNIVFMFIFDKFGQFKVENELNLAENNIFIMDKNQNIIFLGSPILSEKRWNSFIRLVK